MEVICDSQNEHICDVSVYTVHLAIHELSLWISLDQGQGYCQGGIVGVLSGWVIWRHCPLGYCGTQAVIPVLFLLQKNSLICKKRYYHLLINPTLIIL